MSRARRFSTVVRSPKELSRMKADELLREKETEGAIAL